jgi:uncharacterized protein YjiS (DUF1127 family)
MPMLNFLISAGRAFSGWRRWEQAYGELMALDDHSLADIGLHRSQISALVERPRVLSASSPSIPFRNRQKLVRPKES